jgi:hypothetical protein
MRELQRRLELRFSAGKVRAEVSRHLVSRGFWLPTAVLHWSRLVAIRCVVAMVSTATLVSLGAASVTAQSSVPQTNLVPIGPSATTPFPNAGGNFSRPNPPANPFPSTVNPGPPFANPAAPAPGAFGSFDPYAPAAPGSGFGNNLGAGVNITPIGPPTPISPGGGFQVGPAAPATSGGLFGGLFSRPASSPFPSSSLNAPIINAPPIGGPVYGGFDNANVYGQPGPSGIAPGFPGTGFPSGAFPSSSPNTLFPGGIFSGGSIFNNSDPSNQFSAYRLLQGPRLRHAFVGTGDSADDLSSNDTDASLVFAFPNFLYSTQPLYVVPSFSLHLWDGPDSSTGADLPSSAYSAFIDAGWNSDPTQIFSTEFGIRIGAFSDFDTFNDDSIRVLGKALANFRLTPNSTLKAGVYYVDRNTIKLLPAGGLLYQPNPFTRLDLFFPQPKLAQYWRTIGTRDVWWYVAGDYGGGNWTVTRDGGGEDSVDINELRLLAGFEWGQSDAIRAGKRTGFFEIGYAFDRELRYRFNPADDLKLDDGILFRLGIGY